MAKQTTMLGDLINPEVMADMISTKIPQKIAVTPFAKVDDTLQGKPGNTITVPRYEYIGDAEDLAEGVAAETVKLEAGSTQVTVKKAVKAVEITDEAKLSGYGNPYDEAASQLALSVASKMDADAMSCITLEYKETSGVGNGGVQLIHDGAAAQISYTGIVDAVDKFNEELNSEKVLFVNPAQVTTLRKDPDFVSADKYGQGTNVMMTGEVGRIANCRIVPSKRVLEKSTGTGDTKVTFYACPIVKVTQDMETEDEASAITIYMKRGVNVETARDVLAKKDVISIDEHYTTALSNASKVVLAKFKK
ncbi:MAG: N4-gp56 family major capsid protein [Gordonibacter sp.]